VVKSYNFFGSKTGKHLHLWAGALSCNNKKNLESRPQPDEPAECDSGGSPLLGHRDNSLARCDSIFHLLRCLGVWNKT